MMDLCWNTSVLNKQGKNKWCLFCIIIFDVKRWEWCCVWNVKKLWHIVGNDWLKASENVTMIITWSTWAGMLSGGPPTVRNTFLYDPMKRVGLPLGHRESSTQESFSIILLYHVTLYLSTFTRNFPLSKKEIYPKYWISLCLPVNSQILQSSGS